MIVIGIDPGLTGALALLSTTSGLLDVVDVPICDNGHAGGKMRNWLDAAELVQRLIDWRRRHDFARESVHAVIERPIPMPSLPAQTIASQFDTLGALRASMASMGWPVLMVEPQRWKKTFGIGQDKEIARATCIRLYPAAPVTRKKDHNRAEAILIAHWFMQHHEGARDGRALEWAAA
jgi:hypothetical protein